MGQPVAKHERELRVLRRFIEIYCHAYHGTRRAALCTDCRELLTYAEGRLEHCPYDPKPKCKHCPTHCYKPVMRERIREVMKFSGIYHVKRGRLDWLVRYFMT